MADTLAAITARAFARPERIPFLNRLRADTLRVLLASAAPGPDAFQTRYLLAQELLSSGQTRAAIAEFRGLMASAGVFRDRITEENREVFDWLGIAYLRLGEQENCRRTTVPNVCILPLSGAARHAQEEGARHAVGVYQDLLRRFPDDYGSRYLLNIAWMALGGYPDSVPSRHLIPGLAPRAGHWFPVYPNIAGRLGVAVEALAGGLSIDDFNRDGHLDLFMTSWGPTDRPRLFLADGRGGYYDHTSAAGLDGIVGGLNTVHADYDNDGYVDILILRGAWYGDEGLYPNSLLRNRGDGTFEDVTFAAGLASFHPTHSAAWADFNLDGWLDLFVGNESGRRLGLGAHRSELYVNQGDGSFREVSGEVGIVVDEFVKGVAWGDVNNDGLPDLYLSVLGAPNLLYVNLGPDGGGRWQFEERARAAGVERPVYSFPVWFWDYDQDGWEDLLVLDYDLRHGTRVHEMFAREQLGLPVEVEPPRLYRNRGGSRFEDVTRRVGLEKVFYAMGSNFGDLDNDGWLDFYVGTGNPDLRSIIPNRMFRSVRGQRFEEVTLPGGFGHLQKGHGTAFADLDRDGDQDIYMEMGGAYEGDRALSVLFENPGWPEHRWIVLELEGRSANRGALGARVEVVVVEPGGRSRTLYRTVRTGGSFGAGPLRLHIGLGRATAVSEVRIQWPDRDRTQTSHAGLEPNQSYRIVQGEAPVLLRWPPVAFRPGGGAGSTSVQGH
jgi:hypothetical protein